jgi:hypothetical protein
LKLFFKQNDNLAFIAIKATAAIAQFFTRAIDRNALGRALHTIPYYCKADMGRAVAASELTPEKAGHEATSLLSLIDKKRRKAEFEAMVQREKAKMYVSCFTVRSKFSTQWVKDRHSALTLLEIEGIPFSTRFFTVKLLREMLTTHTATLSSLRGMGEEWLAGHHQRDATQTISKMQMEFDATVAQAEQLFHRLAGGEKGEEQLDAADAAFATSLSACFDFVVLSFTSFVETLVKNFVHAAPPSDMVALVERKEKDFAESFELYMLDCKEKENAARETTVFPLSLSGLGTWAERVNKMFVLGKELAEKELATQHREEKFLQDFATATDTFKTVCITGHTELKEIADLMVTEASGEGGKHGTEEQARAMLSLVESFRGEVSGAAEKVSVAAVHAKGIVPRSLRTWQGLEECLQIAAVLLKDIATVHEAQDKWWKHLSASAEASAHENTLTQDLAAFLSELFSILIFATQPLAVNTLEEIKEIEERSRTFSLRLEGLRERKETLSSKYEQFQLDHNRSPAVCSLREVGSVFEECAQKLAEQKAPIAAVLATESAKREQKDKFEHEYSLLKERIEREEKRDGGEEEEKEGKEKRDNRTLVEFMKNLRALYAMLNELENSKVEEGFVREAQTNIQALEARLTALTAKLTAGKGNEGSARQSLPDLARQAQFTSAVSAITTDLLAIINNTLQLDKLRSGGDRDITLSMFSTIVNGYKKIPEVQITYLTEMAKYLHERHDLVEEGMCHLMILKIIYEHIKDKLPVALPLDDALKVIAPYMISITAQANSNDTATVFSLSEFKATLQTTVQCFKQATFFEYTTSLNTLLVPLHQYNHDFNALASLYFSQHSLFASFSMVYERTNIFTLYYRVEFIGKDFGDLHQTQWVYRSKDRLFDFTQTLLRSFPGNLITILDSTRTTTGLDETKRFIKVTLKTYHPEGEADLQVFEQHNSVSQFLETPFVLDGDKAQSGDIKKQCKRKILIMVAETFPNLVTRQKIISTTTVELNTMPSTIGQLEYRSFCNKRLST